MYFFFSTRIYLYWLIAQLHVLLKGLSLPCFTYFVTVLSDFILFVVLVISIFLPIRRFLIVQIESYSIEDDAEFNKGGMLGSLKGIIFIRTFLLVSIKGLCLKVFLVYSLLVV